MIRNKYSRVTVSFFLVLLALWIATPKVYVHALFNHHHTDVSIGTETKMKAQSADDDCDLEKYNKPVYFGLFKFISSFLPLKPQGGNKSSVKTISLSAAFRAISQFRGLPAND